jgi:hypothetical protein
MEHVSQAANVFEELRTNVSRGKKLTAENFWSQAAEPYGNIDRNHATEGYEFRITPEVIYHKADDANCLNHTKKSMLRRAVILSVSWWCLGADAAR